MGPVPFPTELQTSRLCLRPFRTADAPRVFEIQSNWNVARMLRRMPWPTTVDTTAAWLATHEAEWRTGTAYRFALWAGGLLLGCCDLDGVADGEGELGYWLDEGAWGVGHASEAARAVIAFALARLGLAAIRSGCAADNAGSANVLEKLGFRQIGTTQLWSNPRNGMIEQRKYRLER